MAYEIWELDSLSELNSKPKAICYVIDTAIELATKISRGTRRKKVWKHEPGVSSPWGVWGGKEIEVEVSNAYAIIDRTDLKATVRGWGIAGTYYPVKNCKSCGNTGQDGHEFCKVCKGASFQPEL